MVTSGSAPRRRWQALSIGGTKDHAPHLPNCWNSLPGNVPLVIEFKGHSRP
jgi:hypothetical protein